MRAMTNLPETPGPPTWQRVGAGSAASIGRELAQLIEDLGGDRPPIEVAALLLEILEEHRLIDIDPSSEDYLLVPALSLGAWRALVADAEARLQEIEEQDAAVLPPPRVPPRVRATPPSLP